MLPPLSARAESPGSTPVTLFAYPNMDGKMKYELHDELGEILFDGYIEGDILKVKVSYTPVDRPKLELDIQTPPISISRFRAKARN